MNFDLSQDQQSFRDAAREFAEREMAPQAAEQLDQTLHRASVSHGTEAREKAVIFHAQNLRD